MAQVCSTGNDLRRTCAKLASLVLFVVAANDGHLQLLYDYRHKYPSAQCKAAYSNLAPGMESHKHNIL